MNLKFQFIFLSILFFCFSLSLYAQTTIINGKLLGADGKPSADAIAGICNGENGSIKDFVKCDSLGNYSITITDSGYVNLAFCMPNHDPLGIPLFNKMDRSFTLDVQLAYYKYVSDFKNVKIMTDVTGLYIPKAVPMKKETDGTFSYEVKSDLKEIRYQIFGVVESNRSINGTESIRFEPDLYGDYRSIIPVKDGAAKFVFDPSKVLKGGEEQKVVVSGSPFDEKYINLSIWAGKVSRAKFSGNTEELKKLHELIKTKYAEIKELQDLLQRFPVESVVQKGKEIPDFEVASLDNPNEKISKKNMLGKIYMIDFWATWCGPCVGEMDALHKAYEKYKGKGFEIVSFSLDKSPEDIAKFRKEKFPMPWKNAFINDTAGQRISKKFEVIGIPMPILVSSTGVVLEMNEALRSVNLDETLSEYLDRDKDKE